MKLCHCNNWEMLYIGLNNLWYLLYAVFTWGIKIIPDLWMRSLRLREVTWRTQGHTVSFCRWTGTEIWHSNSRAVGEMRQPARNGPSVMETGCWDLTSIPGAMLRVPLSHLILAIKYYESQLDYPYLSMRKPTHLETKLNQDCYRLFERYVLSKSGLRLAFKFISDGPQSPTYSTTHKNGLIFLKNQMRIRWARWMTTLISQSYLLHCSNQQVF